MTDTRSRAWCYTTNNYTDIDLVHFPDVQYQVIGKEVGTNGTPHIQGFIYYENPRSFASMKKKLPRSHIEAKCPKSTLDQAIDYCMKEGDYTESGIRPVDKRGQVNEWPKILKKIQDGATLAEITAEFPEAGIRYANGIKSMYELHRPKYRFSILEKYGSYNPVQKFIMRYIMNEPDDRKILWIYDAKGGAGKTDLANDLMSNHGFKVFGNAKTADVAFAWEGEHVVFDYSRSQQEHINYGVLEDIKNGRIFSGKYQSTTKLYRRPHTIVFANFLPDWSKMSMDRWDCYEVKGEALTPVNAYEY